MKLLAVIATATLTLNAALVPRAVAAVAQRQPSPWGNLEWFELEIDPFLFRFSVLPGDAIMYSKNPRDKEHGQTLLLPRADPRAAALIESLDALIRAHRLMESAPHEPEKTFRDETVRTPSVHFRIGYGTDGQGKNKRWQSYYRSDELPDNVRQFIEDCTKLGDDLGRSAAGPGITKEEVRRLMPSMEKYSRIKITAAGEIHLNDRPAPLEELDAELRRLKKLDGGVLLYQDPPAPGSRAKVTAAVREVERRVRELKLEIIREP